MKRWRFPWSSDFHSEGMHAGRWLSEGPRGIARSPAYMKSVFSAQPARVSNDGSFGSRWCQGGALRVPMFIRGLKRHRRVVEAGGLEEHDVGPRAGSSGDRAAAGGTEAALDPRVSFRRQTAWSRNSPLSRGAVSGTMRMAAKADPLAR